MTQIIPNPRGSSLYNVLAGPQRKTLRLLGLSLIFGLLIGILYVTPASALTPADIPSDIATEINSYNNICAGIPRKYAYYTWISLQGLPKQHRVLPIDYRANNVNLQYNVLIFLCHDIVNENGATYPGLPRDGRPSGASLDFSDQYISNVTADKGSFFNPPERATNRISKNNSSRYWFANPNVFTYNFDPPPPFLTSFDTKISVRNSFINKYSNGPYVCVSGGGVTQKRPPQDPDYGCPYTTPEYSIRFDPGVVPIVDPTPNVSCLNVTTIPTGDLEAGSLGTFLLTVGYGSTGPLSGGAKAQIGFNGSSGPPNAVDGPGGGTTSHNFAYPTAAGVYPVTITFSGGNSPPGTITCPDKITVSRKPYFRVFGGDVLAGAVGAGPECGVWGGGSSAGAILGFNKSFGKGAGTQLVTQALAPNTEFSSGRGMPGSAGVPDNVLAYAGGGTYGGGFGVTDCPEDYWARRNEPPFTGSAGSNLTGMLTGKYNNSGSLSLSGVVGAGKKIMIFVDGDVTINNDITYAAAADVKDIPSLIIIANGDIYIQDNVSNVSGVLVAQPVGGAGGTVYTCSNGSAAPNIAFVANQCAAKQLTITGSVVARTVKLYRTISTYSKSISEEPRTSPDAAEKFIYSPEVWMRPNGFKSTPGYGGYDSITSLPPVF